MVLKPFLLTTLCCVGVLIASAQQRPSGEVRFHTSSAKYTQGKFDIQPIPSEANTWGFVIYKDGKLFIRQPSIPALPGNRGFTTQAKALKAGQLMVDKIRNGQMPPSLTKEEMQKANLL